MKNLKCIYSCPICDKKIEKTKFQINASKHGIFYCNQICMGKGRKLAKEYPCTQCGTIHEQPPRIVKKNKNLFCSRNCYDKYQNICVKLICSCGTEFLRQKSQYDNHPSHYCSAKCRSKGIQKHIIGKCSECAKEIKIENYKIKTSKSGLHFCSRNCTGKYHTRNKSFGVNRSNFEKWLEIELPKIFTDVTFNFNDRLAIGYELDIFIPELKIGIEIQGPTHFIPIYGEERFKQTQELDKKKIILCDKNNIKYYAIDVSNVRRWSDTKTQSQFEEICYIIKTNQNDKETCI